MEYQQAPWFQRLKKPEQQDIGRVVQILHDWANVLLAKPGWDISATHYFSQQDIERAKSYALRELYFFSLYAVGSAITDKENPEDTDLLLVTNLFPDLGIAHTQPYFPDLIAKLQETHE